MRDFSRRSFLKGTAAGALGVAAAGFVLPEVVSRAEAATYTATAQGFAGPVTVTATLAEKIGVPADVFVNEVARYKDFCESGVDEDFGKNKRQLVKMIGQYKRDRTVWQKVIPSMSGSMMSSKIQSKWRSSTRRSAASALCTSTTSYRPVLSRYKRESLAISRSSSTSRIGVIFFPLIR